MQSPEELENLRVIKLKEINELDDKINLFSAEIHNLELRLAEIKETRRQARHLKAKKKIEVEILTVDFWKARR